MGEIKIRNLDQYTIAKIDRTAAQHNLSREEFLRRKLKSIAIAAELEETENKYERLVLDVTDALRGFSEKVEELSNQVKRSS